MPAATPIKPLRMRVLDLSTGIAGGYCAKLLGDAGAEVIKLEPPSGDPLRYHSASGTAVDPMAGSPLFQYLHGGHRSVIADVATQDGQAFARLVAATADLVLESGEPGEIESYGLGIDALHAENPATSLLSISAFGRGGPWSNRARAEFQVMRR
jgi:crotonobetainyl-CoA:carnitine CoA-transferase CaiB-like acyl-CoA transferase